MEKKPHNFLTYLFGVTPPVRCYPLLRYTVKDFFRKIFVLNFFEALKALTDHLEGVESILIGSLLVNWRLGYFYFLILKGLIHKINKKPLDAA
jgi:hypothetical protein